jgi:hypothetical protein
MAAWDEATDGFCKNSGREIPDASAWRMYAEMLHAVRIYERWMRIDAIAPVEAHDAIHHGNQGKPSGKVHCAEGISGSRFENQVYRVVAK